MGYHDCRLGSEKGQGAKSPFFENLDSPTAMDIVPRGWAAAPQRSSDMEVDRNNTHGAEKDGSDDEHGAPLTDDSSDEEEDDEEEALKIQEGFIVDDEDEEEGGEGLEEDDRDRKRKKRNQHRRQSQSIQVSIYLLLTADKSTNRSTRRR